MSKPISTTTRSFINSSQRIALESYCSSEFAYLLEETSEAAFKAELDLVGDTLLKFLIIELADCEGLESTTEGAARVQHARNDLGHVLDAFQLFNDRAAVEKAEQAPQPD